AEAMSWIDSAAPRNRALINLCQAVPSYPPAESLQDELARRVRLPETSLYTDIAGIEPLREALARHMAHDYAGDVQAADTLITAGCNQAFCAALSAIAGPGDNVILPSPWYFNHQMWLAMQGIEIRTFNFMGAGGANPDPAAAEGLVDERTRAIILVSPNNPTGAVFPPATTTAFFELAKRCNVALVLDETYKDFRPNPAPPHHLFQRDDWRGTLIQLYSFSKVFALTGYRAGSIIAGPQMLAEAEKIIDCMAICAPRIGQDAALFGLEHLEDWKREKTGIMAERLAALQSAFTAPGLKYELVSCGAYFAYVRHPFRDVPSKTVAQKLARENDLLCLPGSMFGPGQEDYLRLAFANVEAALMTEAVARLVESQHG
ncbi:MAG: aminotransferase, partial [Aestuariivirgaceae bacterium]|nr:aminotransferase [Aestuariivirgaceae bacterium]